jgi:Sensors of blue-light using FAD.
MFHLVYISSATELFSKESLFELLEHAREKNQRLGITGLLLYREGNILQTLEGEQEAVESLFQTIARDPRHVDVMVLLRGPIDAREFPDWSMAFRDLSVESEAVVPGFSPFLNTPLVSVTSDNAPGRVQTLINLFKKNMR